MDWRSASTRSSRIRHKNLISAFILGPRVPQIVILGSKSGAQRMRRDVNMVQIEEKLIPDLKRGENFLSSSIQYIYRLTYQSASLTFKCHANCIEKSKVHLFITSARKAMGELKKNTTFWIKKWCSKNAPWRYFGTDWRKPDSRFEKKRKFPFQQYTIHI